MARGIGSVSPAMGAFRCQFATAAAAAGELAAFRPLWGHSAASSRLVCVLEGD